MCHLQLSLSHASSPGVTLSVFIHDPITSHRPRKADVLAVVVAAAVARRR